MKVSVIIPVYNVEKYLPRCIKSVLDQTYKDLEIILVDDGTKDNSGVMCDEYATKDERLRVIHKENGGLSSARNSGIEIATGDAIFFLDSDDYLSTACIEKMVTLMKDNDADISIVQMMYIAESTNEEYTEIKDEKFAVMDSERAIEESLYQRLYSCCAPAKLYKRSIIGEIRFPEGRLSEDLATCHLFLDRAKAIVYSSYYGYYYRQHESSIMHVFNPRRMDALEWAKNIETFCFERYPRIIKAASCRTFNVAIHLILDIKEKNLENIIIEKTLANEIKKKRWTVIFDSKARNRERIAAVCSLLGISFLRIIWNTRFSIKRKEM